MKSPNLKTCEVIGNVFKTNNLVLMETRSSMTLSKKLSARTSHSSQMALGYQGLEHPSWQEAHQFDATEELIQAEFKNFTSCLTPSGQIFHFFLGDLIEILVYEQALKINSYTSTVWFELHFPPSVCEVGSSLSFLQDFYCFSSEVLPDYDITK